MKEIYGTFIEKIQRTPTVFSFRFKPDEKVDFIPGQFMEVIFDKEDKKLRHFLSFSSSPLKDYIEFSKRISESRFSQKLKELNPGDKILFKLPLGNCVFRKEYERIGFIIGGIGITPVISILEYMEDKNLSNDVFLIYSNRNVQEIAFKKELDAWEEKIGLKIVYLVDEEDGFLPDVKRGRIDKALISEYAQELKDRINFVFGPPRMVEVITALLKEVGVEEDKIKWEGFVGY